MTSKQYKPIILKVIKEGKKFSSAEEFVDHLISKMGEWEEMFSLAVESMGLTTQSPAQEKGYTPLIITGTIPVAPGKSLAREEDASARFGVKPGAGEMFAENFTKQEVFDYYQRELPDRIEVKPVMCDKPIILQKRITRSPGEDKSDMRRGGTYMTNIRIVYTIPGVDNPGECVTEYAFTTDKSLDSAGMMDKVVAQANAIYRSTQNKVPPRFAIPAPASLTVPGIEASREEILASGAFGAAQTDSLGQDGNGMDLEAIKAWGLPSAPEAAKKYGG